MIKNNSSFIIIRNISPKEQLVTKVTLTNLPIREIRLVMEIKMTFTKELTILIWVVMMLGANNNRNNNSNNRIIISLIIIMNNS